MRVSSKYSIVIAIAIAAVFIGCDGAIESNYTPQIVVQSFLYEGEGIDSVLLHYTTPYTKSYIDSEYAISGADVKISVDGADYKLLPIPNRRGRYYLPKSTLTVQGGKVYTLTVIANGITATAQTSVPLPIQITNRATAFPADRILVLDTNDATTFSYTLTAGPVDNPHRLYMLQITSLDTTYGKVPTSNQGPPVDTSAYVRYSFIQTAPNMIIYSRLFGWFGPNKIKFLALDSNWVDYKRAVGYGDNAFLPFQPSLNHVNNGLGIFASAGWDSITVFLKPK